MPHDLPPESQLDILAIDAWIRQEGPLVSHITPERFRSPDLLDLRQYTDFLFMPWERRQALIEQVCLRRRSLLEQRGISAHPSQVERPAGRLLAFDPTDSLSDGGAAVHPDGLFDFDTIPPWGLWLTAYAPGGSEATKRWAPFQSYMICWVPEDLAPVVDLAIKVNAGDCILWLDAIPRYQCRAMAFADGTLANKFAPGGRIRHKTRLRGPLATVLVFASKRPGHRPVAATLP